MSSIEPLSIEKHRDLRVAAGYGRQFGDNVNQTVVVPTEFVDVQREYPIFFRKLDDGAYTAVALLGLDAEENLFLEQGIWDARYIPASRRHGPFSLVTGSNNGGEEQDLIVQIDTAHPRVGGEKGEQLFLTHGGYSDYLEQSVDVLCILYDGVQLSRQFFQVLEELNLLENVDIQIKLSDSDQVSISGVYAIDEKALTALDAHQLKQLSDSGLLILCYAVLASMGNISNLIARKQRRNARGHLDEAGA